jgi:predicted porin
MPRLAHSGVLLVLGGALAFAGTASAQSSKRFSGSVAETVNYSTNVAGGNDQLAAIRQVTPGDVIYSTLLTGAFNLPESRVAVFVNASAALNRHARNANLNGEDFAISSGVSGRAGPCSGTLAGSFSRAQTAPQDLLIAVTNNVSQSASGTASLSCVTGPIVESVSASVSKVLNDASGLIGTTQKSVSGSVGYGNANFGVLSLTTQYSESGYSQSPLPGLPAPSAPKQFGGGLSYSRKIGLRLAGSAAVSLVQVTGANQSSHGVDANVAMSYRLSQRSAISLAYSRGVQASQLINATLSRTENLSLSGSYALSQRLSVHGEVNESRSDQEGGIALSPMQVRRNRSLSENIGASMTIGRKIAVSLEASHSDRAADVGLFNFSSNSVMLSISNSF